ncbi:MAG: hypothetical protein LKG06_00670 [Bifidobacterium subtile]|jgi:hypothetical protein|nr:hypothetical protein [Bifidobacterium subtile]
MVQSFTGRNALRILILVLYAALVANCYLTFRPDSVFMGMFRPSPDPHSSALMTNVYAMAYMICGLALPLEQPSEYLAVPDCMVYVRQRRGAAHYLRYLALLVSYCCLFTLVQALIAFAVTPGPDAGKLIRTSVCSGWTLLCLLLIANLGYLLSNRALGYIAALAAYALLLSIGPMAKWFAQGHIWGTPAWVPVLFASTCILGAVNLMAFRRLQIL